MKNFGGIMKVLGMIVMIMATVTANAAKKDTCSYADIGIKNACLNSDENDARACIANFQRASRDDFIACLNLKGAAQKIIDCKRNHLAQLKNSSYRLKQCIYQEGDFKPTSWRWGALSMPSYGVGSASD